MSDHSDHDGLTSHAQQECSHRKQQLKTCTLKQLLKTASNYYYYLFVLVVHLMVQM